MSRTEAEREIEQLLSLFPADGPLEVREASAAQQQVARPAMGLDDDAAEDELRHFATGDLAEWMSQSPGAAKRLLAAYQNAWLADATIVAFARESEERNVEVPLRAQNAGICVISGSACVRSALLLALQTEPWYGLAALSLLRSGLDVAALGGYIALGSRCEATLWEGRDQLTNSQQHTFRKVFSAPNCCARIWPALVARHAGAPHPYDVYGWLCNFTHVNFNAVERNFKDACDPLTHATVYPALAYVAWACAVVAEIVTGRAVAVWPDLPAALPWSK